MLKDPTPRDQSCQQTSKSIERPLLLQDPRWKRLPQTAAEPSGLRTESNIDRYGFGDEARAVLSGAAPLAANLRVVFRDLLEYVDSTIDSAHVPKGNHLEELVDNLIGEVKNARRSLRTDTVMAFAGTRRHPRETTCRSRRQASPALHG